MTGRVIDQGPASSCPIPRFARNPQHRDAPPLPTWNAPRVSRRDPAGPVEFDYIWGRIPLAELGIVPKLWICQHHQSSRRASLSSETTGATRRSTTAWNRPTSTGLTAARNRLFACPPRTTIVPRLAYDGLAERHWQSLRRKRASLTRARAATL